jgi:SSS family solute:Na+ symporter
LVTAPKPDEELRGLVWGLTRKEEEPEEHDPADDAWYRSVWLLGGVALGLVVILNIIFI